MADVQLSTLGAVIKAAYEGELDTNAFTDALLAKLNGIEAGATADLSAAEIKALYESNADTNAFTDALVAKLAGIEDGATADQSGAEIVAAINAELGQSTWQTQQPAVPIQEDGVPTVAAPTAINFTGAGVTVTDNGGVADVDISGGGGGGTPGGADTQIQFNNAGAFGGTGTLTWNGSDLQFEGATSDYIILQHTSDANQFTPSIMFRDDAGGDIGNLLAYVTGTQAYVGLDTYDLSHAYQGGFYMYGQDPSSLLAEFWDNAGPLATLDRSGNWSTDGYLEGSRRSLTTAATNAVVPPDYGGGNYIFTAASTVTLTINDNATTAMPDGYTIYVTQAGAGAIDIVASGGVDINGVNAATYTTTQQWQVVKLTRIALDEWTATSMYIAGGGSGGSVPVDDDGVEIVAAPTRLDFTGDGVTVTDVGGVATIDIPGGGGTAGIFRGFKATPSVLQADITGTNQLVNFGNVVFDTDGGFASDRFTVPASLDGATMTFVGAVLEDTFEIPSIAVQIRKNGTTLMGASFESAGWSQQVTIVDQVTTGDYYEVVVTPGAAFDIGTDVRTFFTGYVIGGGSNSAPPVTNNAPRGFQAQMTSTQALGSGAFDVIIFGDELYDSESGYDPITGIYTVPASMDNTWMTFNANFRMSGSVNYTAYISPVLADYTQDVGTQQSVSNGQQASLSVGPVLVRTGDTIETRIFANGNALTVEDAVATNFSGFEIVGLAQGSGSGTSGTEYTGTGVANVDIPFTDDAIYYRVAGWAEPSSEGDFLIAKLTTDNFNTVEEAATDYAWSHRTLALAAGAAEASNGDNENTDIRISPAVGSTGDERIWFDLIVNAPHDTGLTTINGQFTLIDNLGAKSGGYIQGSSNFSGATNGVRLSFFVGNITHDFIVEPAGASGGSGGISGVETQDEGIQVDAAATTLNFVGAGVTATDAGSNVTTVTIPGGGGSDLEVEDEGISLSTAVTKINFAGAGVTATEPVADEILVTIPGGGGAIPTQDDGVEIVASPTAHNFTGAGVTVTDVGGVSTIDIPGGGGGGGDPISAALHPIVTARRTTDDTGVNLSGGSQIVFETSDDTGLNIWEVGNPTRLTVPVGSGITKIRLSGNAYTNTLSGADLHVVQFRRNGSSTIFPTGGSVWAGGTIGFTDVLPGVTTSVIDVSEGDYFELRVNVNTETSETILAGSWMQLEVVERNGTPFEITGTVTGTQVVETFVDTVTGPNWAIPVPTDNVVAWELHVEAPSTVSGTNVAVRINNNSTGSYNTYRGNLYDTSSQAVAGSTGGNTMLTLRSSADSANQPIRIQLKGSQAASDANVDMSGIVFAGANDQFWTSFGGTFTNPDNVAVSTIDMYAAFGDAIPATPVEYRLTVYRDVNSQIASTPASAFRAEQSTPQSLPNSVFGPVEFDTTTYDTTGGYNNTTDTYTVPADLDGRYMTFNANLRGGGAGTLYIQVEGANIVQHGSDNGRFSCSTGPILMATGDTVTVQYFGVAGDTVVEATNFSGYVVQGLVGSGGQGGGGISGVAVQEEGVEAIATATTLNFVGGLVTATNAGGGVADINIGDTLTQFSDFPAGYVGEGTKLLRVNAIEDAVEFVDDPIPVPTTGDASKVLLVNLTEDGYELSAAAPTGVETQDDGSQIVAASTTLNFTGAGVTVTDAGSNVSTINVPTQVVSDFANNWAVAWRGATARLNADDTGVDLNAFTIYDWDSIDNDTDSFWSGAQPSRLTIPNGLGITKIRLHGFLDIGADLGTGDNIWIAFSKNNSTDFRASGNFGARPGFSNQSTNITSGIIDVVDGDYFELVTQMSGVLAATVRSARSYFQIEVVEVANSTSRVFLVPGTILGIPVASQILSQEVITRQATLLAGGGQSQAYANTTATAETVFNITQNGVQVGTVTFAIGSNTGTFSVASDVTFAAGDRVAVVAPATPDATLANISITLDLNLFG